MQHLLRSITHSPLFWACCSLLLLLAYCLGAGFDGLYGQDPYGYLVDARNVQAWLEGAAPPADFFWTRAYSGLGAIGGSVVGDPHGPLLGLSMLAVAGTEYVAIRWADEALGKNPFHGPLLMLMLGCSPFFFRAGVVVMSDGLAIFWSMAGMWMAWRYRRDGKVLHLCLATLMVGAGIMTRYAMVPLLLVPGLQTAWVMLRKRDWLHFIVLPLALLPALSELLLVPGGLPSPAHPTAMAWDLLNLFRSELTHLDGQNQFEQMNLFFILQLFYHPGFLGAGLLAWLGVVLHRRQLPDVPWVDWLLPILPCLLFLGGLPFQNDRFLLPMLPLLVLCLLPFAAALLQTPRWRIGILAVVVPAQAFLVWRATLPSRANNELHQKMVAELLAHPGHVVYALDAIPMMNARAPWLSTQSIFEPGIPPPAPGDLLLSDFGKRYPQWKDLPAGHNWVDLQTTWKWDTLAIFDHDWILYARH